MQEAVIMWSFGWFSAGIVMCWSVVLVACWFHDPFS
jgi:hypothetical protein